MGDLPPIPPSPHQALSGGGVDESELPSRLRRLTPFLMGSQKRPDEGEVFEVNRAELGS